MVKEKTSQNQNNHRTRLKYKTELYNVRSIIAHIRLQNLIFLQGIFYTVFYTGQSSKFIDIRFQRCTLHDTKYLEIVLFDIYNLGIGFV